MDIVISQHEAQQLQEELQRDRVFVVWTITRYTDYPAHVIGRPQFVINQRVHPGYKILRGDTLEEVRAQLPSGLIRFERCPDDDPVVVESWL